MKAPGLALNTAATWPGPSRPGLSPHLRSVLSHRTSGQHLRADVAHRLYTYRVHAGNISAAVYLWHNAQTGHCADCATRLELQADHVEPRELLGDEADRLHNITLRCRRCNVIRRPSHRQGGLTFLTTEAALMWILFTKRPRTYQEYEQLCRQYGLTMANVRFHEAWVMAHLLANEGRYEIDESSKF